jgi:hypothetical protein
VRRAIALADGKGLVDVLQARHFYLDGGRAVELAVVAFAQPPVEQHGDAAAFEGDRRCVARTPEVGSEDCGDAVVTAAIA